MTDQLNAVFLPRTTKFSKVLDFQLRHARKRTKNHIKDIYDRNRSSRSVFFLSLKKLYDITQRKQVVIFQPGFLSSTKCRDLNRRFACDRPAFPNRSQYQYRVTQNARGQKWQKILILPFSLSGHWRSFLCWAIAKQSSEVEEIIITESRNMWV